MKNLKPSNTLKQIIEESESDLLTGSNIKGPFKSVEDLEQSLES